MVSSACCEALNMVQKVGASYVVKPLPELGLPCSILHRLLALRTSHGDFSWYHRKFSHIDASLTCSCGQLKTPEHIVLCRKTKAAFRFWPQKPLTPYRPERGHQLPHAPHSATSWLCKISRSHKVLFYNLLLLGHTSSGTDTLTPLEFSGLQA